MYHSLFHIDMFLASKVLILYPFLFCMIYGISQAYIYYYYVHKEQEAGTAVIKSEVFPVNFFLY